jgi:hypothetical protein
MKNTHQLKSTIMKKKLLTIGFVLGALMLLMPSESQAQTNWEVGVRFGDTFAIDATVPIGAKPRLHPAVYISDRFGVGTYFDWMFTLSGGPRGLKFYPGVGPEFYFENDFDFHIAGNFGVEYEFEFPLTVGVDWRPGFAVTDDFDFRSGNWGVTARFRLGEGVDFKPAN